MNLKLIAKQLANIKQAAKTKPSPKTFRVDWIPEAAGRRLVRQFAMIIHEYRDHAGKRIKDMTMAYAEDGARIQFTLYVMPEWVSADEEERHDEPDPPALHPPPEPGRE